MFTSDSNMDEFHLFHISGNQACVPPYLQSEAQRQNTIRLYYMYVHAYTRLIKIYSLQQSRSDRSPYETFDRIFTRVRDKKGNSSGKLITSKRSHMTWDVSGVTYQDVDIVKAYSTQTHFFGFPTRNLTFVYSLRTSSPPCSLIY
jgi:hypothetical protein